MNFNLFLRPKHQPIFFHAGAGVGSEFGAVVIMTGYRNFDDQFGGVRMLIPEVMLASFDD